MRGAVLVILSAEVFVRHRITSSRRKLRWEEVSQRSTTVALQQALRISLTKRCARRRLLAPPPDPSRIVSMAASDVIGAQDDRVGASSRFERNGGVVAGRGREQIAMNCGRGGAKSGVRRLVHGGGVR